MLSSLFCCVRTQWKDISVQSLCGVRLFMTPWTAACQASLSITNSQSLPKLMSIKSVMPSNRLILCHPFLLPSSIFPSIRVFSDESFIHIRWPKYWSFSFSISPSMNIQDWFPLGLTLISLLLKGLSRAFSHTTVQKISSLVYSPFYCPAPTSIHGYCKNHNFDYTDISRQSNVSPF